MRSRSRASSAAALLTLLLQLLFVSLTPVADARVAAEDAGSQLGVHIEKQGVHHAVHDPEDCVFCIALQLGAVPAPPVRIPDAGSARHLEGAPEVPTRYIPVPFSLPVARAPPAA